MKKHFTSYAAICLALCVSLVFLGTKVDAKESATIEDVLDEVADNKDTLSLREALKYAYVNNPTILGARAELRSVYENLPQAFAGWRPSFNSDASITETDIDGSNFGTASGSTEKSIGVSLDQPIFRGGSTYAEVSSARHTIRAQQALLRDTEQNILLQGIAAFADVIKNEKLLGISKRTQTIIARELEATRDRFDVGELTKTDVSQAEARLAKADADVITSRGNLSASKAVFFQVIGVLPEQLELSGVEAPMPESLDHALKQAQDTNPQILFAANIHRASEDDVDDVFGELLPQLSFGASWDRAYDPSPGLVPEQTSKAFGLVASIPLYQGGATRSRVRQAKHTANQRFLEIREARRQVEEQVVSTWANWQASKAEIDSREAQVSALKVAQEGVRAEAEFGSRTVLDVLDADQEVFDAEVALAEATRNEIVAQYNVLLSMGVLTPQTLGFPEDSFDITRDIDDPVNKIFDMHVDRLK